MKWQITPTYFYDWVLSYVSKPIISSSSINQLVLGCIGLQSGVTPAANANDYTIGVFCLSCYKRIYGRAQFAANQSTRWQTAYCYGNIHCQSVLTVLLHFKSRIIQEILPKNRFIALIEEHSVLGEHLTSASSSGHLQNYIYSLTLFKLKLNILFKRESSFLNHFWNGAIANNRHSLMQFTNFQFRDRML